MLAASLAHCLWTLRLGLELPCAVQLTAPFVTQHPSEESLSSVFPARSGSGRARKVRLLVS